MADPKVKKLHLMAELGGLVKSVNGTTPDEVGNVNIDIPNEVPDNPNPHQQLATDKDGAIKWEDRTHYKRDRITLKLSPKFDTYDESKGHYRGGSESTNPESVDAGNAIGAEILRLLTEHIDRDWIFYWDGVQYTTAKHRLPSLLYPSVSSWPFGYNVQQKSSTTAEISVYYYDDGKEHIFEWEMIEPELKQLDEDFIPDAIARKTDIPEGFSGSWNDLNDKPFYSEREQITHENVSIGIYNLGYDSLPFEFFPIEGEEYAITWDGTSYNCAAVSMTIDGEDVIVVGNTTFFGGNIASDIPVGICCKSGRATVYSSQSGAHTIGVTGYVATPVKIPREYIDSNPVVGVIDSFYYNYRYLNEARGASIAEVRKAAKEKNRDIVIRLDLDNWQGTMRYMGIMDVSTDGDTYFPALIFSTIKTNNASFDVSDDIVNGTIQLEYWYTPLEPTEGPPANAFVNLQFGEINLANVALKSDIPTDMVKTINGADPDETGNIEVRQSTTVTFQDIMGDLISSNTAAEIKDLMLNKRDTHGLTFKFTVNDFTKPMGPKPTYWNSRIDVESYYDGASYLKLKYHIYFGDEIAPVIVDCIENTIVVDPDWTPPAEVALKSDVEILQNSEAHQQLVTDDKGVAKWQDMTHYTGITERNICENVVLTFSENADSGGMYAAIRDVDFCPGTSDTLHILWDGVEYVCQSDINLYGNGALIDSELADTGEPFVCGFDGPTHGAGVFMCVPQDKTSQTHNVTIDVNAVEVVPLPAKYIPMEYIREEVSSIARVYIKTGTTTTTEYQAMLNKVRGKKIVELIVATSDGTHGFTVCNGFETVLDKYIDNGSHEIGGTVFYERKNGLIHLSRVKMLRFLFNDGVVSDFIAQYPTEIYLENYSTAKNYVISVDDNGTLVAREFN